MNWVYNYAFTFSIIMITFEVVLGIALLTGWKKKLVLPAVVIADVVFSFSNQLCCVQRQNRYLRMFWGLYSHYACCYFYKRCYSFTAHYFLLYGEQFVQPLFKNSVPGILVLSGIAGSAFLAGACN